ncbi:MAG: hypothetical protein M5U18_06065 [Dehalococcoidia bacterium]|nr:hypothetical protein [Dehalococcoidia bacterium]
MSNGVARLLDRLNELPEEERERLAENFLIQIEDEDEFDRLIASRPDVLRAMADEALEEERAGMTLPLTEADFEIEAD